MIRRASLVATVALMCWTFVARPAAAQSGGAPLAAVPAPVRHFLVGGDAGRWDQSLPVLMDDPGTHPCAARLGEFLDLAWLSRCMESDATHDDWVEAAPGLWLPPDSALVATAVDRVNRTLFDHGYVNSGIVLVSQDGQPALQLVIGQLVDAYGGACALSSTEYGEATDTYATQRLLESCDPDAAFNLYLLEQDFRRLADDRDPWIRRVNMALSPLDGRGRVALTPAPDVDLFTLQPRFGAVAGVANNRASSVGDTRSFATLSLAGPFPGMVVTTGIGATEGVLDADLAIAASFSPRLTASVRADVNEADVVDPRLRPLDIRSESHGIDASLTFGAVRCPLTPIFGPSFNTAPRRAFAGDGLAACRLAGRRLGDAPIGWSAARDIAISLSVSQRVSRSYLLGQPFSFSPGSVNGRTTTTAARFAVDWLERGRAERRGDLGWTIAARLEASAGLDGTATDIAGLVGPPTDFHLLRASASLARQLGTPDTVISARVSGQWTGDILYTSEKMPIGGVASVRGYEEAADLVDRGVTGSAEISHTRSLGPRRLSLGSAQIELFRFRGSAFVDGATGASLARDGSGIDIASVGVSLSWIPHDAIQLRVQRGWALTDDHRDARLPNTGFHFNLEVRPFQFFD